LLKISGRNIVREEKKMKIGTIVFPILGSQVYLANKKEGRFGAGFFNGYGGKKKPKDKSIEHAGVREMEEEGGVKALPEDLEKVAVVDFFAADVHVFECHVFFCRKWNGEFQETEEMYIPELFDISDPPYERMWNADRRWLPLVVSGKKIRGIAIYNREMTEVVSFEYKEL